VVKFSGQVEKVKVWVCCFDFSVCLPSVDSRSNFLVAGATRPVLW
jgi:hypothetical protein